MDYIWIKLYDCQCSKKVLYLGVFYFPPNTANIGETKADLTKRGHDILIAGDFYIREFKIATDNRSTTRDPRLNELLSIMQITGLQSYNSVHNHQGKTLDLVLSNLDSLTVSESTSIVEHPDRYHPPLEITLQKTKHCPNRNLS